MNVTALFSFCLILILVYLVFWRMRTLAIEFFRLEVFIIRDALFDDARRGMISFEHPAYQMLRGFCNGQLRFSHLLSMWTLIFVAIRGKIYGDLSFLDIEWLEACNDLPVETVERLNNYRSQLHF